MLNIASRIDHTLLKSDARPEDIERLCAEARRHGFHSVCINPCYVPLAARVLEGSAVVVCTVIGFPLGASQPAVKAYEARRAVDDGAAELDMVLNIGLLKAGCTAQVQDEIRAVTETAGDTAVVKVIFETCLLSDAEIRLACRASKEAGAHFVKTSTGFSTGGATVEAVRLMRSEVGDKMGVKAAGGIRDRATALAMIEAGASRLGTSASIQIATGEAQAGPAGY